jgi:hypothetical protein
MLISRVRVEEKMLLDAFARRSIEVELVDVRRAGTSSSIAACSSPTRCLR